MARTARRDGDRLNTQPPALVLNLFQTASRTVVDTCQLRKRARLPCRTGLYEL